MRPVIIDGTEYLAFDEQEVGSVVDAVGTLAGALTEYPEDDPDLRRPIVVDGLTAGSGDTHGGNVISYDDALTLFNLATLTEHRDMDEQVALLRIAAWLDILPGGACTGRALDTWRMTDSDEEFVTDEDRAAAIDASLAVVETAVP